MGTRREKRGERECGKKLGVVDNNIKFYLYLYDKSECDCVLMMANNNWPKCKYDYNNLIYKTSIMLPINKPRKQFCYRPHNKF